MTKINHANKYGVLLPERFDAFERSLGTALPGEYRSFLLTHNGGIPNPSCFVVPDDEEASGERPFACFFALHDHAWSDITMEGSLANPLQNALLDFNAEMPDSVVIPIGKDWSGNYICLGYKGNESGHTFFYDHDYEMLKPLAKNLDGFLTMMTECAGETPLQSG